MSFAEIEEDKKVLATRKEIFLEIIHTERDYIRDLELFRITFMDPLQSNPKLLKSKYFDDIFSNWNELLDLSQKLISLFEKQKGNENFSVGDLFSELAPEFKIYTIYCVNHPNAIKVLKSWREKCPAFVAFEKEVISAGQTKGLNIESYLIKPIQRICKYPILFRELLKNTPPGHPEFQKVLNASDKIDQVVSYINENKKVVDNLEALAQIQSKVENIPDNFEFVSPVRHVIKEFSAFETETENEPYSGSEDIEYTFFLFNDMLLFARPSGKNKLKFINKIELDKLRTIDNISENKGFHKIIFQDRENDQLCINIYLKSAEEKSEIMTVIKQATKEFVTEHLGALEMKARKYLERFEFNDDSKSLFRSGSNKSINEGEGKGNLRASRTFSEIDKTRKLSNSESISGSPTNTSVFHIPENLKGGGSFKKKSKRQLQKSSSLFGNPNLGLKRSASSGIINRSSESTQTYAYEVLKNENLRPPELDSRILEQYLSDSEFKIVFDMTKQEWLKLPEWKRYSMKRAADLF